MFERDFLWGVATASYQIEGAILEDGKSLSIWDTFTHQKGNTYRSQNGDIACDHYHRFKEDVLLMKELGVDVYRFSVSWSRILPGGTGKVNEKGIAFYSKLIDLLLENHIRPFMTLYHWDLPECLENQGGFLNPDFPLWFEEYTKVICQYFGDRVHDFITINEPENCIYNGLGVGVMAPGKKLSVKDRLLAVHHILLAHGRAVKVIREQVKDANIGFSACGWVPVPHPVTEENLKAAYEQYFDLDENRLGDGVAIWYDPIFLGKYPKRYETLYKEDMPNITKEDMELISQKIDFCGVNLYSGYYIRKENNQIIIENPTDRKTMDNGWSILEEVMYFSAKFLYYRYQKPIIITESGCADYAKVERGQVHDQMRCKCLHSYLSWLEKAYHEGVDIRGYFHWSLLDNFEWERGYQPRFGLIYTDYAHHQKRIKKDSFYDYQEIIQTSKRGC